MTDLATAEEEYVPPQAGVTVVYLGPVAPHWEIRYEFGDQAAIDAFRRRAMARLILLPPHDPQFRRNKERVTRDAEREHFQIHWDLGLPEDDAPPAAESEGVAAPDGAGEPAVDEAGETPESPEASEAPEASDGSGSADDAAPAEAPEAGDPVAGADAEPNAAAGDPPAATA